MKISQPKMIAGEIYRNSSYGEKHPLSIPRVSLVVDIVHELGWVTPETYLNGPVATIDQLARFHSRDYIEAVRRAQRDQALPEDLMTRFALGKQGNPIFREMFDRPATSAGSSILAADMLVSGGTVFHPAGGTHHGRADHASGFCYFNDSVLAILRLLDHGFERVLYIDIDAHHGDGVQFAFAEEERVLTVSVHQEGLWPRTGHLNDIEGGMARNLPVPAGINDDEMHFILFEYLLPIAEKFLPQIIVLQCGCDTLAEDPLSKQMLGNLAIWEVVASITGIADRCLVLGGGGYNPYSLARCWSGIWAVINEIEIPDMLPKGVKDILQKVNWSHRLGRSPKDFPRNFADSWRGGRIRDEVRERIRILKGYGL